MWNFNLKVYMLQKEGTGFGTLGTKIEGELYQEVLKFMGRSYHRARWYKSSKTSPILLFVGTVGYK